MSNQPIDVVMTATLRPEIIRLTLHSFHARFLSGFKSARLIINIDPIGDTDCSADDILDICRVYFKDIVYRTPAEPSFAGAVKWCWEQVDTEYFLHLEDDWLLKKGIDFDRALQLFAADRELASVRFNLSHNPRNGDLYTGGLGLNPSIIRKRFVEEALPSFVLGLDPEKQLKPALGYHPGLSHWRHILYGSAGESSYVIDIGKTWRKSKLFDKWDPSAPPSWRKNISTPAPRLLWLKVKHNIYYMYLRALAGA